MSGISGSGLISGIDTASLINQLIQASSGPKNLAQSRLFQLQSQQAAYLDLNNQLNALKSAASAFRTNSTFQTKKATSSNPDVLSATASIGAQPGTYSFIVDRLVSSRQLLTRGFQDRDTSAIGATSFSFDSYEARLDRDVSLSSLNDGEGIERGEIRLTDADGDSADIDLSRAANVSDVLDAINQSGLDITARVRDGHFELIGADSITNLGTADTAGSLGLTGADADTSGDDIIGARVFGLTTNVALANLNDGLGVDYRSSASNPNGVATDFKITFSNGTTVNIGLGEVRETDDNGTPGDDSDDTIEVVEGAVTTVDGLLDRINDALDGATGVDATATIDETTGGLVITSNNGHTIDAIAQEGDATTVRDLGLDFSPADLGGTEVTGRRIFSGLGTTLLRGINGGGDDGGYNAGTLSFSTRSGLNLDIDLSVGDFQTIEGLIDYINEVPGNLVTASLNEAGNGIRITDNTTGSDNFTITGATAESLGIATDPAGVEDGVVDGANLQRRYIGEGTRLSTLRNGEGIGTGEFEILAGNGSTYTINVSDDIVTVADLIRQINSQSSGAVTASINDTGDGIQITDATGGGGALEISDVSGNVASNLRIEGEAQDPGTSNAIDGSFETTVDFDPTDTLDDIVSKLNEAGAGVSVSVLNDGSDARPYRLSFTSQASGSDGRFILDTNGFDLGTQILDEGEDSRVFFGSNDAASAVLLTSSTNTLDDVLTGVNIDLSSTSDQPVQLTVAEDTAGIEGKVSALVTAYNSVIESINKSTAFDEDTGARGALLGDGLLLGLRTGLFGTVQGANEGFNDTFNRLSSVGVSVGTDGKLEFDTGTFREALADDPAAVEALFTRRTVESDDSGNDDLPDGVSINDLTANDTFSELGVVVQLEEFAKNYTDSIDGILTARTQSLDTQILSQQDRIDDLQEGLDRQRASLQQQFIAMERALAQLQSQQSALSSLTQLG